MKIKDKQESFFLVGFSSIVMLGIFVWFFAFVALGKLIINTLN